MIKKIRCENCQYYLSGTTIEEVEYPKGEYFISVMLLGYGSCLFDNTRINKPLSTNCGNHLHIYQETLTPRIWIELGVYPTSKFKSGKYIP